MMTKAKIQPGMQFFIKNDAYRAQQLYMMITSAPETYTYLVINFERRLFDIRSTTAISFYQSEILNEACWSCSGHDVSCLIQDLTANICARSTDHSLNRAVVVKCVWQLRWLTQWISQCALNISQCQTTCDSTHRTSCLIRSETWAPYCQVICSWNYVQTIRCCLQSSWSQRNRWRSSSSNGLISINTSTVIIR